MALLKSAWRLLPVRVLLWPLALVLATESVQRGNPLDVFVWMATDPKLFLVTYGLAFGILNIPVLLLPQRIHQWYAGLIVLVFTLASAISTVKLDYRGEPLLPSDLSLGTEATAIAGALNGSLPWHPIIAALLVILVLGLLLWWTPRGTGYRWPTRIIVAVVAIGLTTSILLDRPVNVMGKMNVYPITWDQKMNYDQNGLMLGFALNAQLMEVPTPAGYSQDAMASVLSRIPAAAGQAADGADAVHPNVIFVMSEAFWDPTLLPGLTFSRDPIPFFHELRKSYTSGTMISPVYGGGTVNTEFEALTGYTTRFLPEGAIAYAQYVRSPQPSLARLFGDAGYATTAVHTYHNWFYRRNEVYQDLGFDKFVSMEFFDHPEKHGDYIEDTEMSQRILQEMKRTPQPDFIYAVSMENHGPYPAEAGKDYPIKVTGKATEESKQIVERYADTVSGADASLKLLIDGLQKSGEPTMVVFFGDHLPMLGTDYSVYRDTGYFQGADTYPDFQRMYGVPFVIWDNFQTPAQRKHDLLLSPSFYDPLVLRAAGVPGDKLTDLLQGLSDRGISMIPRQDYWQQAGIQAEQLQDYQLLQYDLLFGKGYAYAQMKKPDANKDYLQGSGRMNIGAVERDTGKGVWRLTGDYLVSGSVVEVGGHKVKPTWISDSELDIPLSSAQAGDSLQVRVYDSMNRLIAASNQFELPN